MVDLSLATCYKSLSDYYSQHFEPNEDPELLGICSFTPDPWEPITTSLMGEIYGIDFDEFDEFIESVRSLTYNPIYIPYEASYKSGCSDICLHTKLETSNFGHLYMFSVEGTNNDRCPGRHFATPNGYYIHGAYMQGSYDENWKLIYIPLSDLPKLVEELEKTKIALEKKFEEVSISKKMPYNKWGDQKRQERKEREESPSKSNTSKAKGNWISDLIPTNDVNQFQTYKK